MSSTPPETRRPIRPLPPAEVEKICAGEVVERPASVVKELVENALDAGARSVSVTLEDGGKRLLRVTDDGCGIPADELELAVSSHCTSKIESLDELYRSSSLGFRGEALSAIAAVSRLSLTSRWGEQAGARRIEVHGGQRIADSASNLQRGTEVEAADLFFNVPARLKFLRAGASETGQVAALLTAYALAYPEVAFELTSVTASGSRTVLRSDGDGDGRSVLADLLGRDLADGLQEIGFEFPPLACRGFISAPQRHWHNRSRQWYFVNRRPVLNKLLYKALDDAVREYMSPGIFPAGLFLLELPPEEIDVNAHPMKSEVSFAEPQAVYSLLVTAVRRALGQAAAEQRRRITRGLSLVVRPAQAAEDGPASPEQTLDFEAAPDPHVDADVIEQQAAHEVGPLTDRPDPPGLRSVPVYDDAQRFVHPAYEPPAAPAGAPAPRIQQIAGSYLVVVTSGEVFLIDQHAAHERLLFEQFWERLDPARRAAPPVRQALLFPLVLSLAPNEAQAARELIGALAALGFTARLGAGDSLIVEEAPALLAAKLEPRMLQSVLAELADPQLRAAEALGLIEEADAAAALTGAQRATPQSATMLNRLKYLAATFACKAAVKAGEQLSDAQRESLVRQVLERESVLSCPHGRPTVIRLGEDQLEQMFLR